MYSASPMHTDFAAAFRSGTVFENEERERIEMSAHTLGAVEVRSGRISCADPLTMDYGALEPRFAREVPRGSFAVEAAVARFSNEDRRVACARVRFDENAVAVSWEPEWA